MPAVFLLCARLRRHSRSISRRSLSFRSYFVIQAAQRREELQREGDELDAQIRKCEREIRALENTLKHLTVRNAEFRLSFQVRAVISIPPAPACTKLLLDVPFSVRTPTVARQRTSRIWRSRPKRRRTFCSRGRRKCSACRRTVRRTGGGCSKSRSRQRTW